MIVYTYEGKEIPEGQKWQNADGRWHTAKWADWTDEKKIEEGMTKATKVPYADSYDSKIYTLQYSDPVDGVMTQKLIAMDIESIRDNFFNALDAKVSHYQNASIKIGDKTIPATSKALDMVDMGLKKPKESRKKRVGRKIHTFTQEDVQAVSDALITYHDKVNDNDVKLAQAITGASSTSDFEAIDLDTGWPDTI